MTRILITLLLLIAAIGLFIGYTNPTYQNIKDLQTQEQQYNNALTQSSQVRAVRDQLLARRNTFAASDVQKLTELLPDNIDNIRLIIDINDIAARYHLQVNNVSLNTAAGGAAAVGSVGGSTAPVGSVALTFTVAATYANFIPFLQDLEHSLRVLDIQNIKFNTTPSATQPAGTTAGTTAGSLTNDYTMTVQTYWLR